MAFSKELEEVIEAALADGVLTDKERAVLHKKALLEGVDPDELDVVIDGRLAQMKKVQSKPTKEKHGNIITCPNCGEIVPGGAIVCPACGFEFSNIKANNTVKEFVKMLDNFNKSNKFWVYGEVFRMDEINNSIGNYPVPNSTDDLLEMLALLKPRADKHGQIQEKAMWTLYARCCDKAINAGLSQDKRFEPFILHYNKQAKKKDKGVIVAIMMLIVILGSCAWLLTWDYNRQKDTEMSINRQLDSLSIVIDNMPIPDNNNIRECAIKIQQVSWKPISDTKLRDEQQSAIQSFVTKKNAYIQIVNSVDSTFQIREDDASNYISSKKQE